MRGAVAVFAVLMTAREAVTITPAQRDYGRVGVGSIKAELFQVTLPTAAGPNDTLTTTIEGADAGDFGVISVLRPRTCSGGGAWRTGACELDVSFQPQSIGPKAARVVVRDSRGGQATASLAGIGIAPECEMKVVSCNYAHLYSGSFSWESVLLGPYGQNRRSVTVNVVNGRATCVGSATDVSISEVGGQTYTTTEAGTIQGPGLIAVEFLRDSANKLVYRVTGACPSPQWQASRQLPVQPAELGNSYYEQSYDHPASATGIDLVGNRSEQHPDTDPENGMSGTMLVTWSLKRS